MYLRKSLKIIIKIKLDFNQSIEVEETNLTLESEQEETGFNCDLCDFKSSWKNGLIVHIGRKHRKIEQLDGLDTSDIDEDLEDSPYLNTERYWKCGLLTTSYQSYIDANQLIDESSLDKKDK